MKCLLSCCFCIIVYMHASAQTDTTIIKNSSTSLLIQRKALKDLPPFSYHMLVSYQLPNTIRRFYVLPNYQNMHSNVAMKNKWETTYELVGYTLLSVFADNNHYIYNLTRPK